MVCYKRRAFRCHASAPSVYREARTFCKHYHHLPFEPTRHCYRAQYLSRAKSFSRLASFRIAEEIEACLVTLLIWFPRVAREAHGEFFRSGVNSWKQFSHFQYLSYNSATRYTSNANFALNNRAFSFRAPLSQSAFLAAAMYSCYLGANMWSLPRRFSPLQCLFLKPLYRSRTARSSKAFLPSVYSNARWISARLWPSQDKNFTTERYWFLKLKDIFASANPASFHSQISRGLEYCLPSEISSASDVQRTRYSMSEYAGLIGNSLIYIVAYVSCSIFFSRPVFSKKVVFIMNLYKRSPNLGTKKATYFAHFGMAYCDRGSQVYTRHICWQTNSVFTRWLACSSNGTLKSVVQAPSSHMRIAWGSSWIA